MGHKCPQPPKQLLVSLITTAGATAALMMEKHWVTFLWVPQATEVLVRVSIKQHHKTPHRSGILQVWHATYFPVAQWLNPKSWVRS